MSESTITEPTAPENTDADVTAEADNTEPEVELDGFAQEFKERLAETITELNSVNTQVKAMSGDPAQILEALRNSHTDNGGEFDQLQETITKLDVALSKAIEQRDEILKPVVDQMKDQSTENVQPMLDKAAALTKTVNSGRNYLIGMYGEPALKGLPDVVKVRKSAASGDGNSKRIRGRDWFVNGTLTTYKDAKQVTRSSASSAAKVIGVDVSVVQNAFWEAQGTKVATDFKPSVEFQITTKDDNGADVNWTVLSRAQDEAGNAEQGTNDPTENAASDNTESASE